MIQTLYSFVIVVLLTILMLEVMIYVFGDCNNCGCNCSHVNFNVNPHTSEKTGYSGGSDDNMFDNVPEAQAI